MTTPFLNQLKRNRLWSIALYVESGAFSFHKTLRAPRFVLSGRKLRLGKKHVHTYADPFLIAHDGDLYLFFESQAVGEDGKIEAIKTSDLMEFENLGVVLKEPFHLSYPFIFKYGSSFYLVPESSDRNEIALYKFAEFPHKLSRSRVLLKGPYKDSSLIEHNGLLFLFTTSSEGLEIFFAEDLETGTFIPHPRNPVTKDPKYYRCGGNPIVLNDKMYRIAQDGSSEYGKNVNIMLIKELTKTNYHEEVFIDEYFDQQENRNSEGGHHLSLTRFKGKNVIAVDWKEPDLFINKFLALVQGFE